MLTKVHKLQQLRRFLLAQLSDLTPEQLNQVPPGFRNNIIWNVAHLGAAVQGLCYGRSGLPFTVAEQLVTPYTAGTVPTDFIDAVGIDAIKVASLTALDQLARDVEASTFTTFTTSTFIQQRYGVAVETFDQALDFLLYHEGFHAGCVFALKRLVLIAGDK